MRSAIVEVRSSGNLEVTYQPSTLQVSAKLTPTALTQSRRQHPTPLALAGLTPRLEYHYQHQYHYHYLSSGQVEVADQQPPPPPTITPFTSAGPSTPHPPQHPANTVLSAPDLTNHPHGNSNDTSHLSPTATRSALPAPIVTEQQERGQVLGRRRRASDEQSDTQDLNLNSQNKEAGSSPHQHQSKRRKGDDNMLASSDGTSAPNGTGSYTNGKSGQRATASANGTQKAGLATNGASKSRMSEMYLGHDREEVTRILIQALSDMGYHTAAESVSKDSGFELESPTVASFRTAVLNGAWSDAEDLLLGATAPAERTSQNGNGLVLAQGADRNMMRFWIRQQKFLELLEQQKTSQALTVLRTELSPLNQDQGKLHFLSSLLMCDSPEDIKTKAEWDGAYGRSRDILLSELSRCISPSVMLPEHRLAVLLQQVKHNQINMCLYHSNAESPTLYADHHCDRRRFPTENIIDIDDHQGEVWQVVFSHDGTKLASCGSEKGVIIWDVPSFKILHTLGEGEHRAGVGNVAFSWDDSMIITCGQDKSARLWDLKTGHLLLDLCAFEEPVSSCVWAPDNRSFLIGSLDKSRSLWQYDLEGDKIFDWANNHRVEDLALSSDGRWLVAMDDRNHIHVYNFLTRLWEYEIELHCRLTSISISKDSRHLLVNLQKDQAQLFDLFSREVVQYYTGHTGGEYMIRSALGGANESFVLSGSEDGFIYVWHKASAQNVIKLKAHHPRCNSVSWSPTDPCLFASCGDDGKVKIWSNAEGRQIHMEAMRHSPLDFVGGDSNGWHGEQHMSEE
ncbi:WD domain-containing protein [Apiospora arundinis]|uniref:WD domain-containing protein n=1 Tax=Apiospora arundinis TaxID=335852 RepID=A0ABR2I393_9PEZI